ncbi:MAG: tRNA epoxyqueuosine(34) reductase QueG [Nitrosomonadaceae bacterium]|nr:tRNA epoxyqueuosine(34) reductase QueG [Nitrosomonadaceae bacterium]MDW7619169.1 tRNA epoxyqueuosine(34) reductase QueG [Nitrosomonadaceae bacterium]MDW7647202.1 tRNA epoxyqueuosine(34) reductase QueG [Nitrosomonadaceae bacterium]MDW7666026.1 tRNA epoxyqueuosine(34) reductase QueG [Nitrosomonadaceae bacterium]
MMRAMQENASKSPSQDFVALAVAIKAWARELGFQDIRIADATADMSQVEANLHEWLSQGHHGEMDYMAKHGIRRTRPAELVPNTLRVISIRMNNTPPTAKNSWEVLRSGVGAFISRYALGRDYHKVLRARLQKLADKITVEVGPFNYRVFADSAPVMEVEWAQRSGLGWRGKHTLLLTRESGSMFFLGEVYTDLPLPVDGASENHCGSCSKCISICPTQAIIAPYRLDARRCISYLTIEHKGRIPIELRPLIGNRVYGCDDCQLICPWNKFAAITDEGDFAVRNGLDDVSLVELFGWSKERFDTLLAGSPIRRIGHEQWLRNLAVGLGNAPSSFPVINALQARRDDPSDLVREHVEWALQQHKGSPPLMKSKDGP